MTQVVIAIDDEPHNLMLLESYLEDSGYDIKYFSNGPEALAYLSAANSVDAILLDRMMPGMDGMAFMQKLRELHEHATTPVIMQTAAASASEIAEGIAAGVYYYLTKPFARDVLLAIVSRALADRGFHQGLKNTVAQMNAAMGHMDLIRFSFRNLDDVRAISFFLASLWPEPGAAIVGITELMLNAVEHGNLGVTYVEKSALLRAGTWEHEIEHRLELPENRDKRASVCFERVDGALILTIEDMGCGFNWAPYITFDRNRARDSHGRGIAMSRMISFDDVAYTVPGNKVVCRKNV